ncbi:hypothetical protein K7W42_07785 [Deinococcus sp. HMF7604]|uniref:hypothetical protein n=1 Tax=Deinococcus betulae TaxID=2873312 RepID=UPI001CCC8269|nr:hypothetical protein [Deinococcus betulae]MBZ9750760.1 hypothetical protein [Deinococcus betulae]
MSVTVNGNPVPELMDARITPDKRHLILYINDQGVYTTRRINMARQGAGMLSVNPAFGTVMFVRGVKEVQDASFSRVIRTLVGVYACRRDLAEALVCLLWRQEESYPDWREPVREGVPAAPLANAAD